MQTEETPLLLFDMEESGRSCNLLNAEMVCGGMEVLHVLGRQLLGWGFVVMQVSFVSL